MTMINAFSGTAGDRLDADDEALLDRRVRALGPAYRLFYDRPVHPVRGEGVWLYQADGTRLLDAYNNVVPVGHCHPAVVEAIATQAATLNTHTRYLGDRVVDYAERMLTTLGGDIAHVMFTCTGSEANDLALRIARAATGGRGVIVTANAYHGVTALLAGMSPSLGDSVGLHRFVRAVAPPDLAAADPAAGFAARVAEAADVLAAAGFGPATLLVDTVLSSDGVLGTTRVLAPAVAAIRERGGVVIADEVQAGLGRVGPDFWGFRWQGFEPDLVTCGKPMGNGHPVAMVAGRSALFAAFGTVRYFNTFGGNAVSAAAGLAVLDIIERDGLAASAERVGADLVEALAAVGDPRVLEVRGVGLAIAVRLANGDLAHQLVNAMRERGVLISATGRDGAVLKIRPPLVFGAEHSDILVAAFAASLRDIDGQHAG
ncbi:aspartate aminotransferase family protein [Hephaestia sp. GCM10023244]|uniref:aspartate aminotransferase family protein n=1 Tax=unclassified Hephaestia TaxID=2631281 RepID=UPI002077510E|nr:aminotransferase class III-fold pyridoxal phosphate-dependent enzyme [Hephaestia sp. MAHUQ-44]MCM8729823.1 aminotransferase class III-fold pyridoxal phosphate-dependent enzyme [Hephaestia sp. MAHUQ-44]